MIPADLMTNTLASNVGVEAAGSFAALLGASASVYVTSWLKKRLGTSGAATTRLSWAVTLVLTNLLSLAFGVYGELNTKTVLTALISTAVAVMGAQGKHERDKGVPAEAIKDGLNAAEPVRTQDVAAPPKEDPNG